MTIKKSLALTTALCGIFMFSSASADNTVLATYGSSAKKGGNIMNLDIQSEGSASALQFVVNLPKGAHAADVSNCLSGLPKSHLGKCRASKDGSKVAVVVYSVKNEVLPAGMIEFGQIGIAGVSAAKGAVSVSNVLFAGPKQARIGAGSSEVVDLDRDTAVRSQK